MLESEKRSVTSAGTPLSGHGMSVSKDLPSGAPVPRPNWPLTTGGNRCDGSHGLADFANGVVEVKAQEARWRVQPDRMMRERRAMADSACFLPDPLQVFGHACRITARQIERDQ